MTQRTPRSSAVHRAAAAVAHLAPEDQLDCALARLRGEGGPLASFEVGDERAPDPGCIDGRLLEAICERALEGARGAVFTPAAESRVLAAFGLAHAAAARDRRVDVAEAVAALLGTRGAAGPVRDALEGLRVLDFACGGGALLATAAVLARRVGARLRLLGGDVSPLAVRATAARLELLGADAAVRTGDALAEAWPDADLVLANPPFLRHEALPAPSKALAASRSGLSRQADLSAHLAAIAIRHAPVVALVLPRALDTSRSAAPWRDDARARGGFVLRLRSARAGSFAASVDTRLAVWVAGARDRAAVEASAAIEDVAPDDLVAVAQGRFGAGLRRVPERAQLPSGARRVADVATVRFGMKSGANAFFHLQPIAPGRYRSELAGVVELEGDDVAPLLASLKEARAPEWAETSRVLFRPERPSAAALDYVALGERMGVSARPTCAGRRPWWRIAPARPIAPVLYPAKIGARAFAVLNVDGACEDKKWHALFPTAEEPWVLATVLAATPVRLAIDAAARQLTGAQAIADVDCAVLGAAPFPPAAALRAGEAALDACRRALARDPVTTALGEMLDRPAQRELDAIVGHALGMSPATIARCRRELLARVEARLAHAAHVRAALRDADRQGTDRQPGGIP